MVSGEEAVSVAVVILHFIAETKITTLVDVYQGIIYA